MVKSLRNSAIMEKMPFTRKKIAQHTAPVKQIFDDGTFLTNKNYSRTYKFSDINFSVASKEDKKEMFFAWSDVLNGLPDGCTTKLSLINRRMDKDAFARNVLMQEKQDEQDKYRNEINAIIMNTATSGNGIVCEKYLTVSANKKSLGEVTPFFNRVELTLTQGFKKLGSNLQTLSLNERMRLIHNVNRIGDESSFSFGQNEISKMGRNFKDFICPLSAQFSLGHFMLGEMYGRALFMEAYPSTIPSSMLTEFTELPIDMIVSVDILPVAKDEAMKEITNLELKVESDVARWQDKQNEKNHYMSKIPRHIQETRDNVEEYSTDITERDMRLMFGLTTLVHFADTKEQLDLDTETLKSIVASKGGVMSKLLAQQEAGLNTAIPYGIRPLETVRTLTTESAAILIPFNCQEIIDRGGLFYGMNELSGNSIICDRSKLQNANGWIFGVPGSGKSLMAKFIIAQIILGTKDDVIILDPENEVRHEVA